MYTSIADVITTILICVALITVVTLIIVKLVKDRKAGKSSCGNNCAHCAMAGKCHPGADAKKGAM